VSSARLAPGTGPVLYVEGLRVGYGKLGVITGIGFELAQGELVAILGANGAGKTTLLRALSGLLRPTAGRVLLAGHDVTGMPAERVAARGLAHVPENRLVFPSMTVDENLSLGAFTRRREPRGAVSADRDMTLELFPRLASRLRQRAGTLSGGEQQMLAIARGLMARPLALVLDEPSTGLAPVVVREIFEALASLRTRHGLALLLVEQNARAALKIADRVIVMDRGSVVLHGDASEVLQDSRVQTVYLGSGYPSPANAST